MRFLRTGIAALACTAFLAACGGEDDSLPQTEVVTPSTTEAQVSDEPITTEDFIAAGDELCVETFSAVSAAEEDETDEAELYATRANLYEEMVEDLQSLGTPEDEEGLEDLYSAATDLADANNEAAAAAEDGDDTALTAADDAAEASLATFQASAVSFGLEDCGDAAAGLPADTGGAPVGTVPGTTTPVPVEPAPVEPVPVPVEPAPVPEPVPEPAPAPAPPTDTGGAPPAPPPEPVEPAPSTGGGGIGPG